MLSQEIRRKFLKYFRDRDHATVPSSSVVPHDDPTLLFINAGMNQFKDVFLGESKRDYLRAATSQKCIRVGGKHNDLENVGHTKRHLTFFEMLGNFSFGNYFKEDAIKFAWEVSTEIFGLDGVRIYPTVFQEDEKAFEIWRQYVPEKRITRFDEKHNFWAMGDTGPCGPCSELLYDRGPNYGSACSPLEDVKEERYFEFWNLVFMQFNRDEQNILHPLPAPSIDTGAGLERIITLIMDVDSVYDTDILRSLIEKIEAISKVRYMKESDTAAAFHVIADHVRLLSFAIADGVQPSNVERGYVLRKVLRRAVRYGRTLGLKRPFLSDVFSTLVSLMGQDYKELVLSQKRIEEILHSEEEHFLRTLQRGGNLVNQIIEKAQKEKRKITGEEAFKLKDTYGFPFEEILLLAKDAELGVNTKKFEELEMKAKELSKSAHKTKEQIATKNLFESFVEKGEKTTFLGYTELVSASRISALVIDNQFVEKIPSQKKGMVILDKTPFYAEKGGQVGDMGRLHNDETEFLVTDCQEPYKEIIGHIGKVTKGELKVGDMLIAEVDQKRREAIANNHTATHLLHFALCQVLGEHVKQAGSVVDEARLRFDFNHHKAPTLEELRKIEEIVNSKIRENNKVKWYELPYEEASKQENIKQFFGEKYDQKVRVIDIDSDSKELCGGTHTKETGTIGFFRILKESSIAAGTRRIEAVTGLQAEQDVYRQDDLLYEMCEKLKTTPKELVKRVDSLLEDNQTLAGELKEYQRKALDKTAASLVQSQEKIDGIALISAKIATDELKKMVDACHARLSSCVIFLAHAKENTCQLIVKVTDDLVNQGISAKEIILAIRPIMGGSGGGKASLAQAGGASLEKFEDAVEAVREYLKNKKKS